jgi:hypothetical protein
MYLVEWVAWPCTWHSSSEPLSYLHTNKLKLLDHFLVTNRTNVSGGTQNLYQFITDRSLVKVTERKDISGIVSSSVVEPEPQGAASFYPRTSNR